MIDRTVVVKSFVAIVLALLALAVQAQSVGPPMSLAGPFPVACTNVEQDLSRLASGETAELYWRGASEGDKERYVDSLLVSPSDALVTTFTAPADADLYDRWA